MSYEWFIALRYLRARRREAAMSVNTAIAVAGIALGVAALIVALALMVGFRSEVQDKILAGTAHLNLLRSDNSGIEDYPALVEKLRHVPGVRAAAATIYAPVLLSSGDRDESAVLKGVDLETPREANEVFATTIEGDPSQLSAAGNEQPNGGEALSGIIPGKELARTLGLRVGDVVTVVSAGSRLTPVGLQPRARSIRFRVVGIFSSGLYEYDSKWAYASLEATQRLGNQGATAGVIQMKVEDLDRVDETAGRVREVAGPGFMTTTWRELNRPLFAALSLQHRVVIVFFVMLIAIAALNIGTTLTMSVIEKHRDIAILRAQGATPGAITRVFVYQGLMIGLAGALIGVLLGLLAVWLGNRYQLVSIPAEIYSISHVTLRVQAGDCIGIAGAAILISLLATIYPAFSAARLPPVEALRHE
jgi:lipoprotein-releasing system permease protein